VSPGKPKNPTYLVGAGSPVRSNNLSLPTGIAMSRRRRRVFIETQKGRRSAGFTVDGLADAADVSMALRNRGWVAYRLRLDAENHAWIATVIDWRQAA